MTDYSISGLFPEWRWESSLRNMINTLSTSTQGRLMPAFLAQQWNGWRWGGCIVGHSTTIGWVQGGDTTLRNTACYTGFNRRLPDVYPIFILFLTGGRLALCAEVSSIRHTFGSRELTMRLMALTIPRLEPRAPLPGNGHGGSTHGWYGMTVVYPGVYRVYIPGWCIYTQGR